MHQTTTSRPSTGPQPIAAPSTSDLSTPVAGARSAGPRRAISLLRYLDVVLVALATVPVLVLGAPAFGYLVAAGAWVLQRVLAEVDRRLVNRALEPRTRLGLNLFEAFGRIWLLAGAIILAGVAGDRSDGLTAAVTIFCAYSVAFAVRLAKGRPPGRTEQ